jgi:hypothetical protein
LYYHLDVWLTLYNACRWYPGRGITGGWYSHWSSPAGGIVEFLEFRPSLVWLVRDLVATGTLAAAA